MGKTVADRFLISEAAKLSGLTSYMVDYLCRQDVLVPSAPGRRGRGAPRKYSFGDVVMLRAIARLLSAGVSAQRVKRGLHAIRPYHDEISRTSVPARYLVTNGIEVFLHNGGNLLDLDGSGQMSFLFVLELADLRRQVLAIAKKGRAHGHR